MSSRAERDMQFMFGAFQDLGKTLQQHKEKKKKDAIARELAARMYPELGIESADELALHMAMEDKQVDRNYKNAMIQKSLREPSQRGPAYIETEYGPMTPYQAASLGMRGQGKKMPEPVVRGGLMWNGSTWVATPKEVAEQQDEEAEKRAAIEAEIASLEEDVASGNQHWGPESWGLGRSSESKLKQRRQELGKLGTAASVYNGKTGSTEAQVDDVVPRTAPSPSASLMPRTDSLTIPPEKASEADSIRAAYKAGTITREEARAKLAALAGR